MSVPQAQSLTPLPRPAQTDLASGAHPNPQAGPSVLSKSKEWLLEAKDPEILEQIPPGNHQGTLLSPPQHLPLGCSAPTHPSIRPSTPFHAPFYLPSHAPSHIPFHAPSHTAHSGKPAQGPGELRERWAVRSPCHQEDRHSQSNIKSKEVEMHVDSPAPCRQTPRTWHIGEAHPSSKGRVTRHRGPQPASRCGAGRQRRTQSRIPCF